MSIVGKGGGNLSYRLPRDWCADCSYRRKASWWFTWLRYSSTTCFNYTTEDETSLVIWNKLIDFCSEAVLYNYNPKQTLSNSFQHVTYSNYVIMSMVQYQMVWQQLISIIFSGHTAITSCLHNKCIQFMIFTNICIVIHCLRFARHRI